MAVVSQVFYPNAADLWFDLHYYITSHMKRMWTLLKDHGLQGWEVVEFKPGPDGAPPPYAYGTICSWKDEASMTAALTSPIAASFMADVPNYTNAVPVICGGVVVGSEPTLPGNDEPTVART